MRKHQYAAPKERPLPELAPRWIGFTCIYCNDVSGLNAWQIKEMPISMSGCPRGIDVGILERGRSLLSGSINCLAPDKDSPSLKRLIWLLLKKDKAGILAVNER